MSSEDYSNIPTPEAAYADFCLIPVGTGSVSVANEVAQVQRLLKASGLKYTMHSAGTTVGTFFPTLIYLILSPRTPLLAFEPSSLRESVEAHEIRPPPHPPCFGTGFQTTSRTI